MKLFGGEMGFHTYMIFWEKKNCITLAIQHQLHKVLTIASLEINLGGTSIPFPSLSLYSCDITSLRAVELLTSLPGESSFFRFTWKEWETIRRTDIHIH